MLFHSLSNPSITADFKQATILGQAPDGGLYFPSTLPRLDLAWLTQLRQRSREEIAFAVIRPYTGDTIPDSVLEKIVAETIAFPIPLVKIKDGLFSLELFHGPTLAFKDIGARFMSRCLGYFAANSRRRITVLVATSGDTGGAVASGFHQVEGVDVVILYPSGKVSPVQEKQLTTFGGNIRALEVMGNFDDCQQMVKEAFRDTSLTDKVFLTSANSINVARWLPQQFYYFFALQQWEEDRPPVFVVPSGNFGNICAGLMAWHAGLPAEHFIAACNVNDVVPRYLEYGDYQPLPAIPTLSNAMDVGNPSNFVRILEIFHQDRAALKTMLSGHRTTDLQTSKVIGDVYRQYQYLLDPHAAVGYDAFEHFKSGNPSAKGILLETAHPFKFPDAVESATHHPIIPPAGIEGILKKEKKATVILPRYTALKEFLLQ